MTSDFAKSEQIESPEDFLDGRVRLYSGDSRHLLRAFKDNTYDAVVCDPPYSLASIVQRFGSDDAAPPKSEGPTGVYQRAAAGFMGKKWDTGKVAFDHEFWAEIRRVLKPGGHLVAMGGTRTYHHLAMAIEQAGFEIRDQLAWAYGSGFPKSHNLGHCDCGQATGDREDHAPSCRSIREAAWQGWGTALKPAWEPIVLARKPLAEKNIGANVLKWGAGALNIDGCRVGFAGGETSSAAERRKSTFGGIVGEGAADSEGRGKINRRGGADVYHAERPSEHLGRWPANLVHDGSDEVLQAFPDSDGQQGDVRGTEPSHTGDENTACYGEFNRVAFGKRGDSGSAARFFYQARADADDRIGSRHPTVKPLALMQWLCRLVTPPGGAVLDPFAGTGTTGEAAWREGLSAVLIEQEDEYLDDIRRRMDMALMGPQERKRTLAKLKQEGQEPDLGPLFATEPDA